jgi:hypothetical protein
MSIEIRTAQSKDLVQVDQLLPKSLDGGSNEILVATDDGEILAAGFIETMPNKTTEARLRIQVATSDTEVRQELVNQLCEIARSWYATSVELIPLLDIEAPDAPHRRALGFEPQDLRATWLLPLPLEQTPSLEEARWEAIVPREEHTREVLDLYQAQSVSSVQRATNITKILARPERAKLSRILIEEASGDPGTPRVTAALVVTQNKESGFPQFMSVDDPSGSHARLAALFHSASEAWNAAKLQNLMFMNLSDVEPGLLFKYAQENGARMTQQRARWVKHLSE